MPQMPHPFGNEYHTIACGLPCFQFALEISKGKDEPLEHPQPEFNHNDKTVGLLLQLTKSLWYIG